LGRSRSLKVTDFGTDRKPVWDFVVVNNPITVSQLSRRIRQIIMLDRSASI